MEENTPLTVFLSCCQKDKDLLDRLETHLAHLKRQDRIVHWHRRMIVAGQSYMKEISDHLKSANVVLLLISADFIASDYCYDVELCCALERHQSGDVKVVPILLSPCDWKAAPFSELQILPRNHRPIRSWEDPEIALAEVAGEIRRLVEDVRSASSPPLRPHYIDERRKTLSEKLKMAHRQLKMLKISGEDVTGIQQKILNLRRCLREHMLQSGDLLADGRLELIEMVGDGGFATVWKAWDDLRSEVVAVKVLHSQNARNATYRERFFRGARAMASLKHSGIVQVIEERMSDGRFYFFVMELVDGGNLREVVLAGRLSADERLRLVLEAGEALAFAHEAGRIHRDIKPTNILIDAAGRAKLTDFDLVWALDTTGGTRTGMLGTVVYAAPEMMRSGRDAKKEADIYGLAMTAVFALYGDDLPLEVLRDASGFVGQLDVDERTREILKRGVAWEPERRFESIRAFCDALRDQRAESSLEELFLWIEAPHEGRIALWRKVPAGTFWMGSSKGEGLAEEQPRHRVTITTPFRMMAVPVTNAHFAAFDSTYEPRAWSDVPEQELYYHPAVKVSWEKALSFCKWMEETFSWARGARLPTEEEWEYACRAMRDTRYWSDDGVNDLDRVGWFDGNSGWRTHRVGEKQANPWGLHDVHGNVWEWTLNPWASYSDREREGVVVEPTNVDLTRLTAAKGPRAVRGGSFRHSASRARSAYRKFRDPGDKGEEPDQGFRVLLPLPLDD